MPDTDRAVSLRLTRFKARLYDDPGERAMQCLIEAVDDISGAVLVARTPQQLLALRRESEAAIKRLIALSSTALTLAELADRL